MKLPVKYSAIEIAAALAEKDSKYPIPNAEQIAIIEAPLEPAVVVAGAGSGKTETMGARVLFLVANDWVRPAEILGLTFTRKAAGELGLRVRKRLRQLNAANLLDKNRKVELDTTITTYHSYAGRLLSEHAIRCGVDAGDQPIGEAAIWQMTENLVRNWPDENFTSDSALSTVIKDVIGLSRLMLEHGVSNDQISHESDLILSKLESLGPLSNGDVRRIHKVLTQRLSIIPMVNQLKKMRERDGTLTFDDQMSLAATISVKFEDVGQIERSRYQVVLLDEYQDTSQSQVRMLSSLFGAGHPVMAVGDPCQAIYTWRGAAAGTIGAFAQHFPKQPEQEGAEQFSIPMTFRNDQLILELANAISEQIRENRNVIVEPLTARPEAGRGELACGIFETEETEAIGIAEYFQPLWLSRSERAIQKRKEKDTFAVLVRKRSQIPEIELALRAADIPYEVFGMGGLVLVAEVADLIAMMRVVTDPDAGSALMRHLTGPRLNLGAADIAALSRYSRVLAQNIFAKSDDLIAKIIVGNPMQEEADDQFSGSLIDALDEIAKADKSEFSQIGFKRLSDFAVDLRRLRSRAGGSPLDLISEIENYLFLDMEVFLRDGTQSGRRHLDRFIDEAAKFARGGASISDFLIWLDIAVAEEDGLKSGTPEINQDVVSILTIHMAKGLEWDVVAVPGLAEKTFPSSGLEKDNWLSNEKHIPFQLRGDSQELPRFDISQCSSHTEVGKEFKKFNDECDKFRFAEEIRLGYVAVTRARSHLMCSTSRWRDAKKPIEPSELYEFVATLVNSNLGNGGVVLHDAPAPMEGAENPQLTEPDTLLWPRDPLGDKREAFDAAVEMVRSSAPHPLTEGADPLENSWIQDAQALINEIHQGKKSLEVLLPSRLSVSTLMALKENPAELALAIRRPMPRPQDEYSRRGSAFHLWVESYFGQGTLFDDDDLQPMDPLEEDQNLEGLKKAWLASTWSSLTPYAVEVPFETVIGGVLVRGRIDAVYRFGDSENNEERYEVVDWKTGSKKLGEAAAIQLAMYRIAWAKLQKIKVENVGAAFHYVPTGVTDRPVNLLSYAELTELIEKH